MVNEITLEQHLDELWAELSWNDDPKERQQIRDEIWLCELLRIARDWKAQADAEAA